MPRLTRPAVLIAGFALGLAIWALPSLLFHQAEPWNGQGPAYALTLVVAGLLLGFFGPRQLFASVAGVFGGQVVVVLTRMIRSPGANEVWMVSVMLVAGYTFVATGAGAVLGTLLRQRVSPIHRGEERRSR
jgi:hypothetical protein